MLCFSPRELQTNYNVTSVLMSPFALEDSDNGMKCTSKSLKKKKNQQQPNLNIAVMPLLQAGEKH